MNVNFQKYFVKYEDSTISDSVASSELTGNREEGPLDELDSFDEKTDEIPVVAPNSSSTDLKSYYLLYFMLFISCFFSNGFLTAIATYVSMPYGSQAYHTSVILQTLANPIACIIALFRPLSSERGIILSVGISLVLAGYQLFLALGSPCPVFVDTTLGSTLMILSNTLYMFFVTLAKVSFADVLRNKATSRHLLWYGSITQIGSFCGAVVCYPLVNNLQIFQPRYDCQPCPA
ncbi:Oidioi.mRNA.OKI2018_I69.PAR.g8702.t1.cds [Oikopleura dioica]|uniref:Riboflavin transporter n=1 Tax=Oikopleura dioica TaxID=34765 RepID=A0ABN7RH93_OIKDI|nr:Oidioi.mRNA.OKI2018_I69.PAR.g8702.t1.cds [Oikopleura dioica]